MQTVSTTSSSAYFVVPSSSMAPSDMRVLAVSSVGSRVMSNLANNLMKDGRQKMETGTSNMTSKQGKNMVESDVANAGAGLVTE